MKIDECIKKNYIKDEFIGRVISDVREHTSSQEFRVGFYKEQSLELGEVVGIIDEPNDSVIYGIIDEVCMYEDVIDYSQKMMDCNWDFMDESAIKRDILSYAKIKFLRRFSKNPIYDYSLLGITPNLPVYKVGDEGLLQAFDLKKKGVPLGIYALSSGQIIDDAIIRVEPEYLLGKEAAHVNISGQSGFGKSAYMLYFLKAIYHFLPDLKIKTLIFNVKEDDLLWLDKNNDELDETDKELYNMLGVPMEPFKKVAFYATEKYEPRSKQFSTASLRNDIKLFHWGWEDVEYSIHFAIGPAEDWDDKMLQALNIVQDRKFKSFQRVIEHAQRGQSGQLHTTVHTASWGKFARIINGIRMANYGLLRQHNPIPYKEIFKKNDVLVVDINEAFFPEYTQRLILGKIVQDLQLLHQKKELGADYLLIITDELSRYAAKSADRHLYKIKEIIRGISSRGRSIGTPLIGLEQFPSDIDEQILGNVNTKIFSRTKQVELKHNLYAPYSKRIKFEMINLKKGYMFAENSQFPDLIKIRFPRPPCAQKFKEKGIKTSKDVPKPKDTKPDSSSVADQMDALL